MTPTQLVVLALLITASLAVIIAFKRTWIRPKPTKTKPAGRSTPAKAAPMESGRALPQQTRKPPSLLELSKRKYQTPPRKLPPSFTNRPGVKQSQVNLKKTGYREDAKIEEEPTERIR